jgi:hypothetical protein
VAKRAVKCANMRASRGMGCMNPDKIPSGKTDERKKGGWIKGKKAVADSLRKSLNDKKGTE